MITTIQIDMSGAEDLAARLNALGNRGIENASRRAIRKTVDVALGRIKEGSPVFTGILQKAWYSKVRGGWQPSGYIAVHNRDYKPTDKMLAMMATSGHAVKRKDGKVDGRWMRAHMRPKNPWYYAKWAMEDCPTNSGDFSRIVDEARPLLADEMMRNLDIEIEMEHLK